MNSITICGNVTRNSELRHTQSGDAVLAFSVADNQGRDKPAIFWNCSLFGKRADSLAAFIVSGQSVTVVGTITEREWTDKTDTKRKSMDVRVNEIALQGGRKDAEPQEERRAAPKPAPVQDDFDDAPF